MLKINEIFYSIQGESSYSGWPTVFVRTSGCHLRCKYCDTTYAYYEGRKISVEEIIQKIRAHRCRHVCITGGEPLLQSDVYPLMSQLCDEGYLVSLETSGDVDCKDVDSRVRKIIDIKTPDSGEFGKFNLNNLNYAGQNTEYKFVICSERDFEWAEEFCQAHLLFDQAPVLYSPSFGEVPEKLLAEKILGQNSRARLQLQLHKYIWNPTVRGV